MGIVSIQRIVANPKAFEPMAVYRVNPAAVTQGALPCR